MKILYSQSTGAPLRYPRTDDAHIVGLDPDYLVLTQVQTLPPSYDSETQTVSSQYVVDTNALEYRQEWTVSSRPPRPDWDSFNAYMLSDPTFKTYRDTVRNVDGDLNSALFNAYAIVATNGVSAFANVWNTWSQLASITQTDRETLASIAAGFNLPGELVRTIEGI